MWLPLALYMVINVKFVLCFEISDASDELLELTDLFLENLKADPLLLDDREISAKSKQFIDTKVESFIELLWQSQNAVFSRTKRSVDDEISNNSRYSIDITSEKIVPTKYSDDIRLFNYDSVWYAVSLHEKTKLSLFRYENENFREILQRAIEYTTNIAVISTEEFPLILAGDNKKVLVLQFASKQNKLNLMQTLAVENPQHVILWEQNGVPYFSVTDNFETKTNNSLDKTCKIQIYQWLGRHFDMVQEINLINVIKAVPFNIHGSYFLAAVKYKPYQDGTKSYSEIFKFDLHNATFEPYQRVLTFGCTDIKYFTSELHGETHHFLIVVHSAGKAPGFLNFNETSLVHNSKSVIYKYEDQYFTPFQIIETNAVEWQPIQDSQGNTALIAVSKEGLRGFQYDGWHFSESNIVSDDQISLKFEDITALHTYDFEKEQILVLACNHCKNSTNVFKVSFNNFDEMKELHSQLLSWCIKSLEDIELTHESDFVAESLRGDLNEQISIEEDQKRQLSAALTESSEILVNLEDLLNDSLQSDNVHVFEGDIEAENVIFNNAVTFKSLRGNWLNGINIDRFLDNVLDIAEGFSVNNSSKFDLVVSQKELTPKVINNVSLERYVLLKDDESLSSLVVNGSVTFENGVSIQNRLNNMIVNNQNLLLKTGDQEVPGDLIIDDVIIHNLTILSKKINDDAKTRNPQYFQTSSQHIQPISHIKNLKVKNLDIGGLLNRVSVPVLERQALKKSGDQILEQTFFVDSLNVTRLSVGEKLSDTNIPGDFVLINAGEYIVNQDVNFVNGLNVNKLEILHSLNTILVTNEGDLDILLTDSSKLQLLPTKKTFDNLILTNPIKLRNKIKNAQMDIINPVMIDGDSYHLDDDVIIEGLTEVRRWLRIKNLMGQDGKRTFRDVLEIGIKITESQIPVSLNFSQPIDLDDTISDRVNFLNPHDWMLKTSDSPQIVKGQKTFLSDLYLNGTVNAFRLNDVDVQKLQKNVLSIEDDQEIEGVWEVNKMVADQGITSNNTFLGRNPWNSDSTINQNQDAEEFSIVRSNVTVSITKAKSLSIKGRINGLKVSDVVRDIVRKDADYKVFGQKTFKELHVNDLVIREDELDLLKLLKEVINNEVTLDKNFELNNYINVENINFSGKFNNITMEDFEDMANMKSVNSHVTTVPSNRDYGQITVFGEVFVSDNFISGKNLTSIEKDTVKADEDHEFKNVKFGEAITVQNSIQLEGNIENLDLNNIVEQNSNTMIQIENKLFSKDVFIDGVLNAKDTLNGIDLKNICKFSRASGDLKKVQIEGDVIFVKGPKVLNINGLKVSDLIENLWFVDQKANISGNVRLQNTTFYSSVNVEKYIDQTNLKLLSQNYLSKSKDQVVPAGFSFDNVTFVNISTPRMTIKGPINGIVLDDLLKNMLLQDVTQIFESPVYFEEVRVQTLNDDTRYSVNNLNLKTDVMLYDVPNIVTGRKIVDNFYAERIKINHNIKLQDVDVLDWLSNAMLTNGSFSVTGRKVFKNATFKQGVSLRGNLNDQEFNEKTVMLIDTPQNITGKKSFVSGGNGTTKFKILKIKGLVNDMDLGDFVQNQPNKTQNNILNSEIVFNNSIAVKNINIDVLYNDVNVTELLQNITKLGAMEHFDEEYKNLLDMSLAVERSVEDPASFFKYFKEILFLENVYDVFGLHCEGEIFRLLTFSFQNGSNIFSTFEWNIYKKEFIYSGKNIESYFRPNFMEQISIEGRDYIYMEHRVAYSGDTQFGERYFGQLLRLLNSTTFEPVAQFPTNGTKSLISFVPPQLNHPCLGFIDIQMTGMHILCDESGSHAYNLFQTIPMENVYKATTVRSLDSLYLFLARRGLPFNEPSVVVLESAVESPQFKEKQIIFEGAELNGLTAAVISKVPYVAFSFGPREATIDSGRISIRKLDSSTYEFVQWQHIPLSAPLGVVFVTETSFEPLLLAPSADAGSPLQILRYDGVAGFKQSLKGAALSPKPRIRVINGGKFVVAMQSDKSTAVILGAVVKGLVKN